MSNLIPTIGIEVHCELKTKNKVFSNTLNTYGEVANTQINEIDLGYPGTLPKLNKEVINLGIKAALLLNCKINKIMHFDRKNYYYPDLPKGYQITQKMTPIGYDGYVEINIDDKTKKIYLEEIHIEEDTCKSIHEKDKTYLDFNRAGIPLLEIVTKPVIENEKEAVLYLEKLRKILLYANISDVKIEEGSMRCDLNISMKEEDSKTLGTKIEIKNIGSISNVASSIIYEKERQKKLLLENIKLTEETRKYDEKSQTTVLMRKKENKNDYRYFPEPDIPIIEITDEYINAIRKELPLLPDELREKYKNLNLNDIIINALISNKELNDFFLKLFEEKINLTISANIITGDLLGYLNKNNLNLSDTKLTIENFVKLISKIESKQITSKIAKEILNEILISDSSIEDIINSKNLKVLDDTDELNKIIDEILLENKSLKDDYLTKEDKTIKYIIGQIMKKTNGNANPIICSTLIKEKLNN